MKRLFSVLILTLLFSWFGFSSCQRHRIISDEELAAVFHDVFLANAYTEIHHFNLDSLKIYEPIFRKHDCTTDDIQYTIGNFSKRKSARLGDVVERAIDILEEEGVYYNSEVAILDTVNNVAVRTFTREIYADSLIRVRKLADTTKVDFRWEVQPGEYRVDLDYEVDSLDKNGRNWRARVWLERADSTRAQSYSIFLSRDRKYHFTRRMDVDSTHRYMALKIDLRGEKKKQPRLMIRNLELEFKPYKPEAVERLFKKQLNLRIFADEFFSDLFKKDSL